MDSRSTPDDNRLIELQRFELLVSAIHDYAIYMLDVQGHVVSWNAGAARFKGYSADEIIGQHFSRFYSPEDRVAGVPDRALKTAETEGTFQAAGWRVRRMVRVFGPTS
ncbi:PAS domain-containing protein [Variovorax sp. LT1R16]|uniref:PAS domain-containing protein n=1 Tax=Variovorax sp. LT1R16 TaxID=3443728 RepID=UPI003F47E63D